MGLLLAAPSRCPIRARHGSARRMAPADEDRNEVDGIGPVPVLGELTATRKGVGWYRERPRSRQTPPGRGRRMSDTCASSATGGGTRPARHVIAPVRRRLPAPPGAQRRAAVGNRAGCRGRPSRGTMRAVSTRRTEHPTPWTSGTPAATGSPFSAAIHAAISASPPFRATTSSPSRSSHRRKVALLPFR